MSLHLNSISDSFSLTKKLNQREAYVVLKKGFEEFPFPFENSYKFVTWNEGGIH